MATTIFDKPAVSVATQSTDGLMSSTDKTKLDGFPAGIDISLQKDVALYSSNGKAPRNLSVGQYIFWNNVLYRVTTAITGNGDLVVGTNVESVQMGNASSPPGAINELVTNLAGKVSKSGDTMTGALSLAGVDLNIRTASSSSDDSGDIAYWYGNGQEKARLWTANEYTAKTGLNFREYKKDGTSLYSGVLPLGDGTGASGTWPINVTGNAATVNNKTVETNVPANAVFTDTWRPVVDNLTSTDTDKSLSANQGKVLNDRAVIYGEYNNPDFNTIIKAGLYGIQGGSPTNGPSSGSKFGTLLVMEYRRASNNYYTQVFYSHDEPIRIFTRKSSANASTWTVWEELPNGIVDNLTSASTTDALSANQGKVLNDNKVSKTAFIESGTDLNTIVTSGFYRLQNNMTNAPAVYAWSQMIVCRNNDSIAQMVYEYSANRMFVRTGTGIGGTQSWSAWKEVVFATDVYDGLDNTSTTRPLSANQGKILEGKKLNKNSSDYIVSNIAGVKTKLNDLAATLGKGDAMVVSIVHTDNNDTNSMNPHLRYEGLLTRHHYDNTTNLYITWLASCSNGTVVLFANRNGTWSINRLVTGKQATWLPSNGYDPLTSETGYFCYSTTPSLIPAQGLPTERTTYGIIYGDCSGSYKWMLYQTVLGDLYTYKTNGTQEWLRLALLSEVDAKVSKSGDTMTGNLTVPKVVGLVNLPRITTGNANDSVGSTNAFRIREYGNGSSNIPTAHYYHILESRGSDANYDTQLALGMTTNAVYYRNKNAGTWQEYKRLDNTRHVAWGPSITVEDCGHAFVLMGHRYRITVWLPGTAGIDISVTYFDDSGINGYYKESTTNSIQFGSTASATLLTITRSGNSFTMKSTDGTTNRTWTVFQY